MVRLSRGRGFRASRALAGSRHRAASGRRGEDGAVAVLVAVLSTVLFVVAAMVVDLGLARDTRRQAQNAADAASLAAANALYGNGTTPRFTAAVQAAKDFAALNYGVSEAAWSTCGDADALRYASPATACVSFQSSVDPARVQSRPDTVRVRIPVRHVRTSLGALAGVSSIPVASQAEAALAFSTVPACVVCVLGSGVHDVQNGDVIVQGGDVSFNGSVTLNPNGSVTTDKRVTVQGGASGGTYSPAPTTGQPAIADPLAFMPMPSTTGLLPRTNPCTDGPGIYGSFSFPNASCTLQPGLYVIAGSSAQWTANGSAQVTGIGVTLYFTCGSSSVPAACVTGGDGATLDMSGSATFRIQAPTTPPLEGLAIVFDRDNNDTLRVVGTAGNGITGTIYARSATLQMNGNGCTSSLDSMVVVKDLTMNGDPACLTSRYTQARNAVLPPRDLHLSR